MNNTTINSASKGILFSVGNQVAIEVEEQKEGPDSGGKVGMLRED